MPFAPSRSAIHVDVPLTTMSLGFLQAPSAFVAERAFPRLPVQTQSNKYFQYPRGYLFRDEMEKRGPAAESAGLHYDIDSSQSYFCDVFALHRDVADQDRANYQEPLLGPDREATQYLTQKRLIKLEKVWVAKYFVTGVWTTEWAGVASGPTGNQFVKWSVSTSTPIEDVRKRKTQVQQLTGIRPNKMAVGQRVMDALLDHPEIIDRIKYGQTAGSPAMANEQILAQLFQVDEFLVLAAIENTAQEGAADAFSFIGGDHALLFYAPPAPGLYTPSAGYTFVWTGYQGSAGVFGTEISRFRIDLKKCDRFEIESAFDQKLIAADLGALFLNAV